MFGRDAGLHVFCDHVQNFGRELSSFAHGFEITFGMDFYAFGCIFIFLLHVGYLNFLLLLRKQESYMLQKIPAFAGGA